MDILIIIKLISLFIGIWLTIVNIGRLLNNNSVSIINFLCQAIGITVFIIIQLSYEVNCGKMNSNYLIGTDIKVRTSYYY